MMFGKPLERETVQSEEKLIAVNLEEINIKVNDLKYRTEVLKKKRKVMQVFNFDPFIKQIHFAEGVLKGETKKHEFF